jgi:hypothetical protein
MHDAVIAFVAFEVKPSTGHSRKEVRSKHNGRGDDHLFHLSIFSNHGAKMGASTVGPEFFVCSRNASADVCKRAHAGDQVIDRDAIPRAYDATLEQRECGLDRVGRDHEPILVSDRSVEGSINRRWSLRTRSMSAMAILEQPEHVHSE